MGEIRACQYIKEEINHSKRGLTPPQLKNAICETQDVILMYNCAKALRHIKKIEGGNPEQQWFDSFHHLLYDLELLNISRSLLEYGRKLDHTFDWNFKIYNFYWYYQLGQTKFHIKEAQEALLSKKEKAK